MEVSTKLKERFCKDCNIPLRLYQEPYFMDRLELYDKFYGTMDKWDTFTSELAGYHCEQDYLEEYNHVKDQAIEYIKSSWAYKMFNEEDMNNFKVTHEGLPAKDIFKSTNDGRTFISIDMRKANFSALKYYGETIGYSMFGYAGTVHMWEDFLCKFTSNNHILDSKYIRQVILGNCNAKRQCTYEKWIMDQVLNILESTLLRNISENIVFLSNDEIVYDATSLKETSMDVVGAIYNSIRSCLKKSFSVPFRVELFTLHKINGTSGYYKEIYTYSIRNGFAKEKDYEFKCLDNYMLPFVLRKFQGEEITENDKVFYHEGLLSKFIEVPEIEVNFDE